MSDMPERVSLFRRDPAGASFTAYKTSDVAGGDGDNEYIHADTALKEQERLAAEVERLQSENERLVGIIQGELDSDYADQILAHQSETEKEDE